MSIKTNQIGDTIVEVMIAIAVIGMVLGVSYATAARALRAGRAAQEQTEALKLAESQVEKLKYLAGQITGDSTIAGTIYDTALNTTTFCIDDNFTKVIATSGTFAARCNGRSGLYDQLVEYESGQNLYKVTITWDTPSTLGGTVVRGNVEVSYRLFR